MKWLRVGFRLLLIVVHIVTGCVIVLAVGRQRRDGVPVGRFERAVRWWLGRVARIAGVRVHVRGAPAPGAVLLLSNHVSWLDIPVLGGIASMGFLSKAEVRGWPVVGWFATASGTRYIERGAHGTTEVIRRIEQDLRLGRRVHVFAEATTSDGSDVRRFHPRLLAAAQEVGCPVQPVAIRYLPTPDGRPSPAPFIDNAVLLHHALRVLAEPRLEVEVTFLPIIGVEGRDRRGLADDARAAVRAVVVGDERSAERA
ncbi:1-acyl-sn-glycerol-3-phosphate acyltransferase [Thioalkalivibrio denitrificans]|uniref:1-acyl-sn-glycerol-3-phosphate acyltransferase n=1 Tax=Thioalkalivibrio denitrificans TaxID=108003 RepID=A0A1V3NIL1_9GAMM|nr:1-acyl-sn-glycerol-3-phosphate acyltransferase [Thioalkalivibrio denitrificans]OOG24773.1 1-acyl-sn-glycerol-3-phosphate acyltransferase [Thioalkalivibrio denitrificans]